LVGFKKMNASKPLMKYRNSLDDIKTGGWSRSREERGGNLIYCPGGVRYRGGMSLNRAFIENIGICRFDTAV
jgi:hypothetical protein